MKTNEIKSGTEVMTNQLGPVGLIPGIMRDNMRGNTRIIETKASTVGMFDETGSIYAFNIIKAKNDRDEWELVEHTPAQLKLKTQMEAFN